MPGHRATKDHELVGGRRYGLRRNGDGGGAHRLGHGLGGGALDSRVLDDGCHRGGLRAGVHHRHGLGSPHPAQEELQLVPPNLEGVAVLQHGLGHANAVMADARRGARIHQQILPALADDGGVVRSHAAIAKQWNPGPLVAANQGLLIVNRPIAAFVAAHHQAHPRAAAGLFGQGREQTD